jgi:hypothetical protein
MKERHRTLWNGNLTILVVNISNNRICKLSREVRQYVLHYTNPPLCDAPVVCGVPVV